MAVPVIGVAASIVMVCGAERQTEDPAEYSTTTW